MSYIMQKLSKNSSLAPKLIPGLLSYHTARLSVPRITLIMRRKESDMRNGFLFIKTVSHVRRLIAKSLQFVRSVCRAEKASIPVLFRTI